MLHQESKLLQWRDYAYTLPVEPLKFSNISMNKTVKTNGKKVTAKQALKEDALELAELIYALFNKEHTQSKIVNGQNYAVQTNTT